MFNRLRTLFASQDARSGAMGVKTRPQSPGPSPSGYYPPQSLDALVSPPPRQHFLQQLNENNALPDALYRQLYLAPLFSLLSRVQNVPATRDGEWAYAGAFGDLTLKFTTYAVRLAKGRTLPPGIPPEEQAEQGLLWNAVVFWCALFYHLPLLCELEGELEGGDRWLPGFTVPGKPFRFRYSANILPPYRTQGRVNILASQLLPTAGIAWLSGIPDAFDCLAQRMQGQPATVPLIDELLLSAAEKAAAPSLTRMTSPVEVVSQVAAIVTPTVQAEPLAPAMLTSALPDSPLPAVASAAPSAAPTSQLTPLDVGELVSVLGSAIPHNIVPDIAAQPEPVTAAPEQDDTQALMGLLSGMTETPITVIEQEKFHDNLPTVPHAEKPDDINVASAETEHHQDGAEKNSESVTGENNKGTEFLEWLSAGLISGEIDINEEGSRAHLVAGFVFLCVPEIFYLFQKKTGNKVKRNALQSSFERLGVHRVSEGERFIQAKVYSTPSGTGTFRHIHGYLVKASTLYRGNRTPDESRLLILP
ncbi:conjugal transfer nickase/helicase domain-containing protein [Dickeya parazeae]|uniref:conjugal transfer nickase/helicase domain-containing protein n=1 Tax=Dickeya parazeae TaxID=2893572 RepID=UPI001AED09D7|nr:TraI domain-containing protein [Dickeya parazeae]MBP2834760.1 TraI domain-containing protein [Dickeya parazeae]